MLKRALVVFSGGLDSILASSLLQKIGFQVTALTFVTPFFDAEKAKESVQKLGLDHIIQNITELHLPLVKNPPRGYGKNMNPCLDCHGLMFHLAGKIMQEQKFDLLATGEVLGQRPFSQNKQALALVEKIAGIQGRILRPLSAQNLPITEYELQGIIDRNELLDIEGKSRKRQMALAQEWGIDYYPTPAGGCLLTDPIFSERLKDLFSHQKNPQIPEINLLKVGRHFWLGENKIVIGRTQIDNQKMSDFFQSDSMIILKLKDYPGPLGVIFVHNQGEVDASVKFAAEKIKYYALKTRDLKNVEIIYNGLQSGNFLI